MVNKDIFKISEQLQNVVETQMQEAKKALSSLPEGATKDQLEGLLKRASSGKISPQDAQKEVKKIIEDARTN